MGSPRNAARLLVVLAAVALVAMVGVSSARAWADGGVQGTWAGPVGLSGADQLACLGATPESVVDVQLIGENGSAIDATGGVHASINMKVKFTLSDPDPLVPDQPGELLYRGIGAAHFVATISEWPPDGYLSPFDSVTFPVRDQANSYVAEVTVTLAPLLTAEGIMGWTFGEPRCAAP